VFVFVCCLPAFIVYCVSNLFIFVNLGVLIVNNIVNTILLNMSYWTKRRKINARGMTNHRNGPQRTICEKIKPNLSPLLPFSDLFWSIVIRCG